MIRGVPIFYMAACCAVALGGCTSMRRVASQQTQAARQMALLGCSAMEQGKERQAEELFQEALRNCPVEERAHRNYGELLWKRGEHRLGMEHVQRAVELSPGDVETLVRLGRMHLEQGDLAGALGQAEQAIARDANSGSAWALRGEVLLRQGRLDEALGSSHRALNLLGQDLQVEMRVAEIYRRLERPRRVLATLDAIAGRYSSQQLPPAVLREQHLALKALGRMQSAEEKLAELMRREPTAEELCQLGELRRGLGRPEQARQAVARALALDPDHRAAQSLYLALSPERPVRRVSHVR